jgi:hypothetical protein
MTVQMVVAWNGLEQDAIYDLGPAEESRLIGLGLALPNGSPEAGKASNRENFVRAERFGILPTNADNAPGFALFAAWLMGAGNADFSFNRSVALELGPGDYYVDGAQVDATFRGAGFTYTPRFQIRGAGRDVTRIISKSDSTAPVVLQILAGYIAHNMVADLSIVTRTDIRQDALSIVATRRTLDNTGGITKAAFQRFSARSHYGDALVLVGGSDDFLAPNQFLELQECSLIADRGASFKSLGQLGQVRFAGGDVGAYSKDTAAAASTQISPDNRAAVQASAVDTTNEFITSPLDVATGTPVRFIGTNLPGGLSTGTTYYVRRYAPGSDSDGLRFTVHTSQANVASDTRVNLTSAGTVADWRMAPLYVTSVGTSVLNFEFPHNFPDHKKVQLVGASLPTGLSAGVDYWVIRRSAVQIALASSLANAQAGTAITFSGGTVTLFALTVPESAVGAATVIMDGTSVEGCLQGVYVSRSNNVIMTLHCEENKQSVYVYQADVRILGGLYSNAGDDGGAGVVVSGVGFNTSIVVEGCPIYKGTIDKLVHSANAAVRGGGWIKEGTSHTTAQSSGIALQISAAATLDIAGHDFLFVNTSATTIQNISSRHGPRAQIKLMAWSGSIVLGSSGNIRLPAASATLTVPENGVVTLELLDTVGTWVLVARSF